MYDLTLAGTKIPRCQHIKADGVQCNLPAVRGRSICHRHQLVRRATDHPSGPNAPLVHVEDAASLQLALNDVIRRLMLGHIDRRDAALIITSLRALLASMRMEQHAPTDPSAILRDHDKPIKHVEWKRHMTLEEMERHKHTDEKSVVELFKPVIDRLNKKYAKDIERHTGRRPEPDIADTEDGTPPPPVYIPPSCFAPQPLPPPTALSRAEDTASKAAEKLSG
jgi:hypothetical protein